MGLLTSTENKTNTFSHFEWRIRMTLTLLVLLLVGTLTYFGYSLIACKIYRILKKKVEAQAWWISTIWWIGDVAMLVVWLLQVVLPGSKTSDSDGIRTRASFDTATWTPPLRPTRAHCLFSSPHVASINICINKQQHQAGLLPQLALHPPIRIHVDVAASNSTKLDFFINSLYHPPIDVSASNSTKLDILHQLHCHSDSTVTVLPFTASSPARSSSILQYCTCTCRCMLYIYISASNSTKLDLEFHNSLYHPPIRIHVDVSLSASRSRSNSTKLKLDFFIKSLSLSAVTL